MDEDKYVCESGLLPFHKLPDSMNKEFSSMMSKARNANPEYSVVCKKCYKKITVKKKIIFKSWNFYVYMDVKV